MSYYIMLSYYLRKEFKKSEWNKNIRMNVVADLVKSIEGSGHNFTTDKFFTSITLADKLCEKKLTLVGMIRTNKSAIPTQFQNSKNRVLHDAKFCFQTY